MPTHEHQITAEVVATEWTSPLRSNELSNCFGALVKQIEESATVTHVLFNVKKAGNIPAQAPFLFFRSGITKHTNLGRMAVIGTNPIAQILAQMAVSMTGQNILFFATESDAMDYIENGE